MPQLTVNMTQKLFEQLPEATQVAYRQYLLDSTLDNQAKRNIDVPVQAFRAGLLTSPVVLGQFLADKGLAHTLWVCKICRTDLNWLWAAYILHCTRPLMHVAVRDAIASVKDDVIANKSLNIRKLTNIVLEVVGPKKFATVILGTSDVHMPLLMVDSLNCADIELFKAIIELGDWPNVSR